jgi:hypothetical protein
LKLKFKLNDKQESKLKDKQNMLLNWLQKEPKKLLNKEKFEFKLKLKAKDLLDNKLLEDHNKLLN